MSHPYIVRQLAELCAAHTHSPKILLAPAVRAGHELTTALVRQGCRWANLRVTTPVLLAAEDAEPSMVAQGARRLPAEGRRRLVADVLTSWPAHHRRYFLALEHQGADGSNARADALVEPLQRTLDALRLADVLPEHLELQATATGAAKMVDLAALYSTYSDLLAQGSWWDDAALFRAATSLEHAPGDAIWMILDETELSSLAEVYVRTRSGSALQRLGRRDYGVSPPATSAAIRFTSSPIPDSPSSDASTAVPETRRPSRRRPTKSARHTETMAQGDLFLDPLRDADAAESPGSLFTVQRPSRPPEQRAGVAPAGTLLTTGLTVQDVDRVHMREVIGLESEVRCVLREVLDHGLPLDDVEIVYTATSPYEGLLYDAVQRWDVPADFAAGIPATFTHPGQRLHAFLMWISEGSLGTTLARRLQCGDIEWLDRAEPDDPGPATVARWLLQGRAGAGRAGAREALERLSRERNDADFQERLGQASKRLAQLFDLVPAAGSMDEHIDADDMVTCAVAFLQSMPLDGSATELESARRQRDQLIGLLQGLLNLPGVSVPVVEQARWLASVLQRQRCDAQGGRPGHLRLAALRDAAYSGRRHLYILGLDESRFPGNAGQDPILLDDERRALSPRLNLQAASTSRATFQLIRVLGSATGSVTLVASRLHLADGREPYPTPLFELARRQLGVTPATSGPVPGTDEGVVDDLEALLAQRHTPALATALAQVYPSVARGRRATLARQQAAPSRFSGWIARADTERLDLDGDRILSSRMLETLAECPRRYLWRYGLGLSPPDEPRLDPRRWLHPMEMGNLLHGLFVDFMQQLQGSRPMVAHAPKLQAMARDAIDAARARVPVTLEAAFRNDCRRIERAADIFLLAEAQRLAADPALRPEHFELDFGFDTAIEVRLSHEVAFRLRGRIDRIDAASNGVGADPAYEIWDYKTGSTFNYSSEKLLKGGLTLQWALYAHALPHLVDGDGHVRLSGYFFASDRGAGHRFSDAPPARHELAAVLQPLFELAGQGLFPALHKGDARGGGPCRFCDYRRVCHNEARGTDSAQDMLGAATELAALVDGWAETVSSGRSGSRESLESALRELGLQPGDLAPEDAARSATEWITRDG